MKMEQRDYVMKAVVDPNLLQDKTYAGTLEYILGQYSISMAQYHEAIASKDHVFFGRIMAKGPAQETEGNESSNGQVGQVDLITMASS